MFVNFFIVALLQVHIQDLAPRDLDQVDLVEAPLQVQEAQVAAVLPVKEVAT